jgi:hypothetical protein
MRPPKEDDTIMNVKQAAQILEVSAALVYALCRTKKLRHERHGLGRGRIVITPGALEEYRQRSTVGAGEPPPAPRARPVKLRHLEI